MAQEFITATRLSLLYDAGVDGDGKRVEKTKTYSKVKNTATANELYAVAAALNSVTTFSLVHAERLSTNIITSD